MKGDVCFYNPLIKVVVHLLFGSLLKFPKLDRRVVLVIIRGHLRIEAKFLSSYGRELCQVEMQHGTRNIQALLHPWPRHVDRYGVTPAIRLVSPSGVPSAGIEKPNRASR